MEGRANGKGLGELVDAVHVLVDVEEDVLAHLLRVHEGERDLVARALAEAHEVAADRVGCAETVVGLLRRDLAVEDARVDEVLALDVALRQRPEQRHKQPEVRAADRVLCRQRCVYGCVWEGVCMVKQCTRVRKKRSV